jgi:hypothetical protein
VAVVAGIVAVIHFTRDSGPEVTVLRPVDAQGNVQSGWQQHTEYRNGSPIDCSFGSPSRYDVGGSVRSCGGTADSGDACWPAAESDHVLTHGFRFPLGTFWRIPVSTTSAPTGGATQQGAVDLDVATLVVACDQSGSGLSSAQLSDSSSSSTASGPAAPVSGDDESASFDALRLRLLWTGDWSTFSAPDFWVTIAGVTFGDAQGALSWCLGHNLDRDHCYAKLVSTTHPVDGSTAFNP